MGKKIVLLASILASLSVTSAFAYECQTTQAGPANKVRDLCGTITDGIFSADGSSIYGATDEISAELTKLSDGRTKVCVDACASEGDTQVYAIVSQ